MRSLMYGSILESWDHDPTQNEEQEAQATKPPMWHAITFNASFFNLFFKLGLTINIPAVPCSTYIPTSLMGIVKALNDGPQKDMFLSYPAGTCEYNLILKKGPCRCN